MAEQIADKITEEHLLRMTTDVVAAYVSNNNLPTAQLPDFIASIYASLRTLDHKQEGGESSALKPAVPIRKSITPDYLICLEDGKKLKMLKRHLKTAYNMSPEAYRERWGLPSDYPMVAPNYARQRSRLAKEIGLGTRARRGRA